MSLLWRTGLAIILMCVDTAVLKKWLINPGTVTEAVVTTWKPSAAAVASLRNSSMGLTAELTWGHATVS